MTVLPQVRPDRGPRARKLLCVIPPWARFPLGVYLASRVLFFLIAVVDSIVRNHGLSAELSQWDGFWYLTTAIDWYPHTVATGLEQYSTLGFMPVYPGLIWVLWQLLGGQPFAAGLVISMVFGVIATLAVSRLALEWWAEAPMRRAVVFWSFWPGTIVFSMVYGEALVVTFIAGAMLLMARKRWLSAGLLAGAATATAPIALAIVPAMVAAAIAELRRVGWTKASAQDRRSLLRAFVMPVLSAWGIIAFAVFLWRWTGTPLASYHAQQGAWQESSSPLAIPRRFGWIVHDIFVSNTGVVGPGINLNDVVAVLGAVFLLFGLWRIWKWRDTVPLVASVFTVFGALLLLTSGQTSPNPRMLLCLFPVLLTIGAETTGRRRTVLLTVTLLLTFVMSWLTFVGSWMLP